MVLLFLRFWTINSFREFGASEEMQCVSVNENLLHSGGLHHVQSHLVEERGKNRKTQKAIVESALEVPETPPPRSSTRGQFTLSAYWQLAIQMTVSPSPLSLPLKFPFAGTRGDGPFCAIYRSEVKAAFFLQKATEMSPAVNICLATTRSCTRPFKQFDQNKRGPDFWKGYNFTGGIMTWPKYVTPFFRMAIWWALF